MRHGGTFMPSLLKRFDAAATPPPWVLSDSLDAWTPVLHLGERREWPGNAVLYQYGDKADELVLILDGLVGIQALSLNGLQRNIGNLGPGSILGATAFFHDGLYRHTIRCIVPCTGIVFSGETVLRRIFPEYPSITLCVTANLAAKSYMMSSQLEYQTFMSGAQRLAHFLYHLGVEQEKGSWLYGRLSRFSLGALGEVLGMHRVTVTNLINRFKKEGIVSMTPCLRVTAPEALNRIFLS
jgi:CRP-like cAMP-binding protein